MLPPRTSREQDLALRAARAVGGRSAAHRLLPDNTRPRGADGISAEHPVALRRAVEADDAFYVDVTPDMLAVDFDREDAEACARKLHVDLLLAGLAPVTGPSGGLAGDTGPARRQHVFARLAAEDERVVGELVRKSGGQRRKAIRPPYSAHRSRRSRSEPSLPDSDEQVLERLTRSPAHPRLAAQIDQWIREDAFEERGIRSDVILMVASALASTGWTRDEVLLLLHDERYAVARTYASAVADRGYVDDHWFTDQIWHAAVSYSARSAVPRGLAVIRAALAERVRPGRARATDLRVMGALCDLAGAHRSLRVSVSIRELLEKAGIGSPQTLIRSLRRLEEDGLLRPRPRDPRRRREELPADVVGRCMVYELLEPEGAGPDVSPSGAPVPASVASVPTFRNGTGLGSSAGLVYDVVNGAGAPLELDAITASLGLSARQVRRALTRLAAADNGLLERTPQGWTTTARSPIEVAPKHAVDAAEAQRNRHRQERETRRHAKAALADGAERRPDPARQHAGC